MSWAKREYDKHRLRGRRLQARRERWFRDHPLCVSCEKAGRTSAATELDHIIPLSQGGSDSDPDNWQGLCEQCHRIKSAGESSGPGATLPGWLSPVTCVLHIVHGAPGSGKSTFVDHNKAITDQVIDLDEIVSRLNGKRVIGAVPSDLLRRAIRVRNEELAMLAKAPLNHVAWFIVGAPGRHHRQWWHDKLRPSHVHHLDVPKHICAERIRADIQGHVSTRLRALDLWWQAEQRNEPIRTPNVRPVIGEDGWPMGFKG